MRTNSREEGDRKGDHRLVVYICVGAGIGMTFGSAVGSAVGDAGMGMGLGTGIGIALGIARMRVSRAPGGDRAEPSAPPNGGPATQPGNLDAPQGPPSVS